MNSVQRDDDWTRAGGGGRHAVVVGGSVAGLLAAHVLAEHAHRVTVVERDRLPDGDTARPGVPHSRHPHVLLEGGRRALEELLPGFTEELRAAGAPRVGLPGGMVQWQAGHWVRRVPSTTYVHTGSRVRFEGLVRRRVLAHPAITVVGGTEVAGLLGDATRVRGVRVRERGEGAEERDLAADLVVDASGRGTRASRWLEGIGADPAPEDTIDTGLAYASRVLRDTTGDLGDHTFGFYVVPHPANPHGCVVVPLEDGTYLATFSGLRGDEPPTDEDAYVSYAKRLPHPFVERWMSTALPLSPVSGFRRTANVRRRYDRPGRRPAGFLAVGDALCTVNPIYGQGMSVAAMSAVALRDALADPRRTPTTRRVQQALCAATGQAWSISAGSDKNMPGAVGSTLGTSPLERPVVWYLRRVQERSPGDPVVGRAFRAVLSLSEPVTALFALPVLKAVLLGRPTPTREEPPMLPEGWPGAGDELTRAGEGAGSSGVVDSPGGGVAAAG